MSRQSASQTGLGRPVVRRHLTRAALLSATALGLALAPQQARAQDVVVMNGQTFDVTMNPTIIDSLNIQTGGTVQLNSNALVVNDNVDTVYAGTTHGVVDNSFIFKQGSGTVTLDNYTQDGGELHINGGGVRIDGGSSEIRYLTVGSDGGNGVGTMTGGTLNIIATQPPLPPMSPAASLQVGDFGGTGVFNQSGGTVIIAGGASFNVGNQGGTGTYNISGGELRLTDALYSLGRSTNASRNSDGTLNISGTGLVNMLDGTFTIGDRAGPGDASTAHGTVMQTGGTFRVAAGVLQLAGVNNASAVDGRYDLLGGTLEIGGNSLQERALNDGAVYQFNLGGGTIKVIGSTLNTVVNAALLGGSELVFDTNGLGANWGGTLTGAGGIAKLGGGTLTLQNAGNSFTGGIRVEGGTLVGSVDGALPDGNALVINGGTLDLNDFGLQATALGGGGGTLDLGTAALTLDQGVDTEFDGAIVGAGGLIKNGAGTLILGGNSTYADGTAVTDGALVVNGSIASYVTLSGDALLGGSGTLAGFLAQIGTTVAPGNSIGTMNVGDATFDPGSTFVVEVDDLGNSDLVNASGTVTINGGDVQVLTGLGVQTATPYIIVNAANPVVGTFDSVATDLLFVSASLDYSVATQVMLVLVRNATAFADVAETPNQMAVAGAVDMLPPGDPLADALATLGSAEEAQQAFDMISGEVYATARGLLLDDSRFPREAIARRLNGEPQGVKRPIFGTPAEAWIEAFGSFGSAENDGNAAGADRDIGGVFVGLDAALDETFTLGVMAGYSQSGVEVDRRGSDLSVDSFHLGAYAGADFGGLMLQLGGAFAWHTIDSTRHVVFGGVDETETGDYDGWTGQLFGEAGYRFDFGSASVEPFAGLAWVNVSTDGFTEDGGIAALTAEDEDSDALFTTLGLRGSATVDAMQGLSLHGSVGWRHAFGDQDQEAGFAFQGGSGFTIEGLPLAEDTVVLEAGIGLRVMPGVTLGLNYNGQIGDGVSDQGFNAGIRVSF